ncbi:MAG: (deoxy)nucleoside triphosphate pyrophosphohydrolase [Geodermatophilaceae bacterium]
MAARCVVGAAILDGHGRVLAAQRAKPPDLAGRWEFPGGKLRPGESEHDGLVRECAEELGVTVAPQRFVGDVPIPGNRRLRVWTALIVRGEPSPIEHRELRWVTAEEIDDLDWLEPDRPLLPALKPLLSDGYGQV